MSSALNPGDDDAASHRSGFSHEEESEEYVSEPDSEPPGTPPTPPGTPPPEELRKEAAIACVDRLFRRAKLHILGPPKWTKLFLNAARQYEARLDEKREQLFMAVAQDDTKLLLHVKEQVSEDLFNWWGYDLDLVVRTSHRLRPNTLKHLPDLVGDPYPGIKHVTAVRASLDVVYPEGSSRTIQEMQRGKLLVNPLRECLEYRTEINVDQPGGLKDVLEHKACGPWQDTEMAAIGVNFGFPHNVYAHWRPIHFIAANPYAKDSAIPALDLLFEAKADGTLVEGGGCTALHLACCRGHLNVVKKLLDYGCPLDAEDRYGCSAITTAARCRNYPIIREIAMWSMPPDAHDALFHTPAERLAAHYSLANGLELHIAVCRGNFERVQELVALEPPDTADPNYADPSGRRAVHLAAGFISNEMIACDMLKILVGKKADVNARDANSETALHVGARLGRAQVVKTLLLLHAHPNIPDFGNRTPLMLAAAGPKEEREPPAYNGQPQNKPLSWNTLQDVLDWNGRGEAPIRNGPEPRRVRGEGADRIREIFGARNKPMLPPLPSKKHMAFDEDDEDEDEDEEEEEEESEDEEQDGYFTINDCVLARAKALCELGFDDQCIIDTDGRVNRGDRMQLFGHLFQPQRNFLPSYPGETAPLVPNDVRCRFLWKHLTGPMLQMEQQGILPPRPSQLLAYVLRVMLGKKGPAFGVLVSYGYDARTVPLWTQIEEGIKKKMLPDRLAAISKMGFVGGKPKLQKWCGAKWNFDEYPRWPVHAPWGAFAYLDKDDKEKPPLVMLQKHEKYNVQPKRSEQAFKDNFFTVFESQPAGAVASNAQPLPSRQDQLTMANRIYLNETAGVRKQVEPRARLIGEMLICPLLTKYLKEFEEKGAFPDNSEEHDILNYLGLAMKQPHDAYVYVNQPRRAFKDLWEDVEDHAVRVLCCEKDPILLNIGSQDDAGKIHKKGIAAKLRAAAKVVQMVAHEDHSAEYLKKHREAAIHEIAKRSELVVHQTAIPHQGMDQLLKHAPKAEYGQFALLNEDDKHWLLRSEATRAFIELKRCSCIETCEEFSELVCSIAVGGLQDFHGRFWRAAFGLLIWGRGKLLLPIFEAEISRRLPKSRQYELKGPILRPRADVLTVSDLAVEAKRKLALMASEPPWETKLKKEWGDETPERPPLDHHAGKPDGGVKMPTGISLFNGFTDILHAQVLCEDAQSLQKAFKALTGPPLGTKDLLHKGAFKGKTRGSISGIKGGNNVYMTVKGQEGRTKFAVLRVINDFREDQQKVIPLCAGIKLVCIVGWTPLGYGPPMEQMVEIELMLKATEKARWLCKYMDITPDMMPRSKKDDEEFVPVFRKSKR